MIRSLAILALIAVAASSVGAIRVEQSPTDVNPLPKLVINQEQGRANTTIVVHVVNDTPNPPPQPPQAQAAAATTAAPLQNAIGGQPAQAMPATQFPNALNLNALAAQMGGLNMIPSVPTQSPQLAQMLTAQQMNQLVYPAFTVTPAADLINVQNANVGAQTNTAPAPLSVTTPAADLLPSASINPITSSVRPDSLGTYAMQTVPGVRIVAEDGTDCGCDSEPCANPCSTSVVDQIERTLDGIKSQIVIESSKVQQENRWVRAVKDVIKHYTQKLQRVESHSGKMKENIKKLFSKKKRYEDMLLQHQLDEEKFKQKMQKKEWKELKDATTTSSDSANNGDCQSDCCDKYQDAQQRQSLCNCNCNNDRVEIR